MVQNATVVLEVEKPPELDMKEILEKVKDQYAAMASRAREDAEQMNQRKVSIAFISKLLFNLLHYREFLTCFEDIMPSILM